MRGPHGRFLSLNADLFCFFFFLLYFFFLAFHWSNFENKMLMGLGGKRSHLWSTFMCVKAFSQTIYSFVSAVINSHPEVLGQHNMWRMKAIHLLSISPVFHGILSPMNTHISCSKPKVSLSRGKKLIPTHKGEKEIKK